MGSNLWYLLFPIVVVFLATYMYKSKKIGVLIFASMVFFSIFRGDNVGNDTKNYMDDMYTINRFNSYESFEYVGLAGASTKYEVITNFVYYCIYNWDLPTRTVIYFFSIVTFVFLGLSIYRYKSNLALACMFFVLFTHYFYSLTAARQIASVSILLFAYTFLEEKTILKYLFFIFVAIASMIHISSMYFLIVYFIRNIRVNRESALTVVSVLCLLGILTQSRIVSFIISLLPDIGYLQAKVMDYGIEERSIVGLFFLLLQLVSWVVLFYLCKRNDKKTDTSDILFLTAMLVFFSLSSFSTYINRFSYGITVFCCLYLAKYINIQGIVKNAGSSQLSFLLFLMLALFSCYSLGSSGLGGYYLVF